MTTIRRIGLLIAFAVFVLISAVFAYANRGVIDLDLGFVRLEQVSVAGAFVGTFIVGAVFGLGCAAVAYLKVANERRRLRRLLTEAESEVGRLRSAPLKNAD